MTGRASSVSIKRRGIVALLTLAALALALAGCGDGGMAQSGDSGVAKMGEHAGGAAFGHVHGLGINPRDGALFIATHGGLFRAAAGDAQARQVVFENGTVLDTFCRCAGLKRRPATMPSAIGDTKPLVT